MRGAFEQPLEAQLAIEARLQGACGASADFGEGVAAFLEKRAPRFQGF
jgi:2-(1,2-epoxy-1,2-dihydrophenyl)acetyl-CoA isomerase